MKKWIAILSGLLIIQVVLALALNMTGEDYSAFQAREKLLTFDKNTVDSLKIEDGSNSLTLKKQDGKWRLPESSNFPTSSDTVEQLLDKLAALEKGWPVATSSSAAQRFKLDDKAFERKLTLLSKGNPVAELYVGTSPGFRKVHVRSADEDTVYAAEFNTWEANAKTEDWIDKDVLRLKENEISRVDMPDFTLQRNDDKWQLVGLGNKEETNTEEVHGLMNKLSNLRIQSLLGTEDKPEYGQNEPELEFKLARQNGEELSYRISKPKEGGYYVLTRSDLDQYFKVAELTVKPIKDTVRAKLVKAKAEETPAEPAADGHEEGTETTTSTIQPDS